MARIKDQFNKPPNTTFNTPNAITQYLPFVATPEQVSVLQSIQQFIEDDSDFLIVRGAAGTGKTSIMKAVACYLDAQNTSFQLLAPTGRAAKNIASKTGYPAGTIHSAIYSVDNDSDKAIVRFVLKLNIEENHQVFIVDESSMIGDRLGKQESFETANSLMSDFLKFIKQGAKSSKIVFVGDSCQLPPVGYNNHEQPPALSVDYLTQKYTLSGRMIELSKVMRQAEGSYILDTAYQVREYIMTPSKGHFTRKIGSFMGKPEQVAKLYIDRFNAKKQDAVAIIAYGNKYVSDCNNLVRAGLGLTGSICEGDRIVLNQNYYGKSFAYVSNGEVGEIKSIGSRNTIADLSFVDVEVEFKDSLNLPFKVRTKVMLDTLKNPNALTQEKKQALYAAAFRNNPVFRQSNKIWDDEYLSAMQIGYGHAFSCHKAQGSEWDTVLLNSWSPNKDHRFLYTGITRARKNLYTNSGHLY